jgi:hypothetical protein
MTERDRARLEKLIKQTSLEVVRWEDDCVLVRTPYGTKGEAMVKVSGRNFHSSAMLPVSSKYGMHVFNEEKGGTDIFPSF